MIVMSPRIIAEYLEYLKLGSLDSQQLNLTYPLQHFMDKCTNITWSAGSTLSKHADCYTNIQRYYFSRCFIDTFFSVRLDAVQ